MRSLGRRSDRQMAARQAPPFQQFQRRGDRGSDPRAESSPPRRREGASRRSEIHVPPRRLPFRRRAPCRPRLCEMFESLPWHIHIPSTSSCQIAPPCKAAARPCTCRFRSNTGCHDTLRHTDTRTSSGRADLEFRRRRFRRTASRRCMR